MKKFENMSTFIEMTEKKCKKILGGLQGSVTTTLSGGGVTKGQTTHVDGYPDDYGPSDHAPQD